MMGEHFGMLKPISEYSVLCFFLASFRDFLLPGVRQYDQIKTEINKSVLKLPNKKHI
jgi:hypothetical protein